jgi:hypothetical protein
MLFQFLQTSCAVYKDTFLRAVLNIESFTLFFIARRSLEMVQSKAMKLPKKLLGY